MDEWSLERMKEQDPRWELVERSFSQQLTRSTYQMDSIAVPNSQKKSGKMHKIQGLAITKLRFHSVVVITSALHAEGHRFDAGWDQTVLKSICEYCTQGQFWNTELGIKNTNNLSQESR